MPFVIDASVAANWLLPDEEPEALDAWQRIANDPALVPLHWWFEVRNILLTAERRQRIAERSTANILDRLSRLRIMAAAQPEDHAVLAIARRRRLTFYDAAYLELAQRERIPIATLDLDLAAASRVEGVPLIGTP